MGKAVKAHLEGRSKEQRAKVRQQLGSLKSLTVQPQTRVRYERARQQFYQFLYDNDLSVPKQPHKLDLLLGEYLEHLWSTGEGRGKAADTLASIQDLQPRTKGQLPVAWRLLRTWHINEIPCRAPPLPEMCLQAMLGWSIFHEEFEFGLSLLIGFYGLLRTGELLEVKSNQVFVTSATKPAVISLGLTKGGKRMGASESVSISVQLVLVWLIAWKKQCSSATPLCPSSSVWRAKFNQCIEALGLSSFSFRPYSLRRGGAIYWFSKHGRLDKVVVLGRWAAQKTARIYINEGLSVIAEMTLPKVKLQPFLTIYKAKSLKPRFT